MTQIGVFSPKPSQHACSAVSKANFLSIPLLSYLEAIPNELSNAISRFLPQNWAKCFLVVHGLDSCGVQNTIGVDALLFATTTIGNFPTLGPPRLRVGRLRYGPKQQVQGDPVTFEKSSPNQTTWAGVLPRPHHPLPTFLQHLFSHAVKATVNPPIPQTLVKWPGRVTSTQRKGVRPE